MPWLASTFLQLLRSLVLCCCRHCPTAMSFPSSFRQKRVASRRQAACSCGVPMCACAENAGPDSKTKRVMAKYRMRSSVVAGSKRTTRIFAMKARLSEVACDDRGETGDNGEDGPHDQPWPEVGVASHNKSATGFKVPRRSCETLAVAPQIGIIELKNGFERAGQELKPAPRVALTMVSSSPSRNPPAAT